jgi:hypothetical protein
VLACNATAAYSVAARHRKWGWRTTAWAARQADGRARPIPNRGLTCSATEVLLDSAMRRQSGGSGVPCGTGHRCDTPMGCRSIPTVGVGVYAGERAVHTAAPARDTQPRMPPAITKCWMTVRQPHARRVRGRSRQPPCSSGAHTAVDVRTSSSSHQPRHSTSAAALVPAPHKTTRS